MNIWWCTICGIINKILLYIPCFTDIPWVTTDQKVLGPEKPKCWSLFLKMRLKNKVLSCVFIKFLRTLLLQKNLREIADTFLFELFSIDLLIFFDAFLIWRKEMLFCLLRSSHQECSEETTDGYITELRNLSLTCEFQGIRDGLILYKLVDGNKSNQVRDVLLQKGSNLNLKAIEICREDEVRKSNYR